CGSVLRFFLTKNAQFLDHPGVDDLKREMDAHALPTIKADRAICQRCDLPLPVVNYVTGWFRHLCTLAPSTVVVESVHAGLFVVAQKRSLTETLRQMYNLSKENIGGQAI